MKKILMPIIALCFVFLISCDVKKSKEYKELKAQQDSLMMVNQESKMELAEMMDLINEIETDFNQIRETEKILAVESQGEGSFASEKRTKIQTDMTMIKEIIEKNKVELNKLNTRLKNSTGEIAGLKKTVERLNSELKERSETIVQLQTALEKRDIKISNLESSIAAMKGDLNVLSSQTQEQADKLKEQEKLMNTAYYMFGSSKELKEAKVISGGFLKSTKILSNGVEESKFIAIDKRFTKQIPVYSKKAKILSDHPEESYVFKKDEKDEIVIEILDENKFWSLTPFLIVETK